MFLRHSPTAMIVKDGNGDMPSAHAQKHGHMECYKLLTVAQCQFRGVCSFSSISLPVYVMVMKWCRRAKDRYFYTSSF